MPVTLKELAARAQVHPSTISRVANHDPKLRIAPPTRMRIEALLRETEYRPNGVARGLKLRQTLVLAVVIPDITNPFFAALFRGVEDAASPRGYNVLLCNTDGSPARQRSHLQSLHARRVDGVIMASSFLKDPTVRWLRHQGIPYVLVNRFSDEGQDPFVGSDDLVGGRLATEHLIELGHRRIGHLAGKLTVSTGVMRRRGYLAALAERGLTADPRLVVESGYTEDGGARAAERLLALPDRPTAIFAVTDMTAVGAFGVARRMGVRIPEDLAIVGYNDIPLATRMVPTLSTVHVPIHHFGAAAARLLLEQIETGEPSLRRVIFNPELIVRGSSVAGAASAASPQPMPTFATE
ncbi:MAG TPA: LacI family DNA-binding transcriptional regulator [Candidatus Dormibacteraeota bacterium]|nr:LacI family DNA-binding transcriptional regulator [Candidatus Dormibacteraeota bacterium]